MSKWKHNYGYLKSDSPQFRLVSIHPGAKPFPIEASLVTHALHDHPPYEALSYVWGETNLIDPDLIILNGCGFHVTYNLWVALYALRDEKDVRTFWIDAICVDQDDLDERSSQVQLMREIYKGATRTVVWLGGESFWSLKLFEYLKSTTFKKGWDNEGERQLVIESQLQVQDQLATDEHVQKIIKRGLYNDLAQRPFWKRIWIVQEVVLASQVTILCGPDEMAWSSFALAIWNIDQIINVAMPSYNPAIGGLLNLETIDCLREIRNLRSTFSLADLIACLRGSRATDPRDMVYGLLGLVADTSIRPDYSKATTRDVYTSLVEQCVKEYKSLDIITMRRKSSSDHGLASWVPDWSDPWIEDEHNIADPAMPLILKYVNGNLLHEFTTIDDRVLRRAEDGVELKLKPWCAHGQTLPKACIAKSLGSLTARGVLIGSIIELGDVLSRLEDDGELFFFNTMSNWEELMLRTFGNCKSLSRDLWTVDIFDNFLKIMDKHLMEQGVDLSVEKNEKYKVREQQRTHRVAHYSQTFARYVEGGCLNEAFLRTLLTDIDMDYQRLTVEQSAGFWDINRTESFKLVYCMTFATNRRLLITENGYIGLAPIRAQKGDRVCVLYGCSVPLVIREREGMVTLVGEAYVHGVMDGQAIDLKSSGMLDEREWTMS
ncbi:hypothetical protein VE03_03431 [Pseudogymnoascus sp. 23342-1-I1]|nr:hypothetical protein VE03_03431 [Pseudogymnoascus sp. 23342-1-I1]